MAMLIHGIGRDGMIKAAYSVPVASGKDDADFFVFGPDYGWMGLGGILASGSLDSTMQISPTGSWSEPEHSVAVRTKISEAPLELNEAKCTGYVKDNFVDVQEKNSKSVKGSSWHVGQGLIFPLTIIVTLVAAAQ